MKTLNLQLSVEEANVILSALGQLPYQQVHGLITKIHGQANVQIEQGNEVEVAETVSNGSTQNA